MGYPPKKTNTYILNLVGRTNQGLLSHLSRLLFIACVLYAFMIRWRLLVKKSYLNKDLMYLFKH